MAIALLSTFGSTYLCEQIFSRTEDHSDACVRLKVSKFSPNITELSKDKISLKSSDGDEYSESRIKNIGTFSGIGMGEF